MNCSVIFRLGMISLLLAGCTKKTSDENTEPSKALVYTNGMAASVVIGQTDFTSKVAARTQSGRDTAYGITVADGKLYTVESGANRVLGFNAIPTTNGADADFVIGQINFTNSGNGNSSSTLNGPHHIAVSGSQVFVADTSNHRVLIYNTIATPNGSTAAIAVGQASTSANVNPDTACGSTLGCGTSATTLNNPVAVSVGGGKMAIADSFTHRVLLYNSIPTADNAAANIILGQTNTGNHVQGNGTGGGLYTPQSVWTDGTRVVVSEGNGHRVLIWNTWPTSHGQSPDLVLGQPTVGSTTGYNNCSCSTPAANSLFQPHGVASNGTELAVVDGGNNRVLIWSTWPTSSHQDADLVLGPADFTTAPAGSTTASTFDDPQQVFMDANSLYVADYTNNRFLIFKKQ